MNRALILCICGLVAVGCNRGGTQVFIPALDRPAQLDLLCADITNANDSRNFVVEALLPLEACAFEPEELADGFNPNKLATITEVQRGEVLTATFTERNFFDTNTAIPGFTGFIVGEQPTGIQISSANPDFTYVSSFSARSLQAYMTDAIIGALPDDTDPFATVEFNSGPAALLLYESVDEDQRPSVQRNDMDLVTGGTVGGIDYRWLFVAIPDLGVVQQVRWDLDSDPPTFTDVGTLTLETTTCAPPGTTPPQEQALPQPDTPEDYNRVCPNSPAAIAREVKTVQTTQTCTDGLFPGPRPVALHLDDGGTPDNASDDILLVADANQPVIHRFALAEDGATAIDGIPIGTPTTALATTPFVPATVDNRDATQRYLYAISAVDKSIVAIDYSPILGEPFGEVLPVLAGISSRANEEGVESRNRVRSLFANVRAIEVITPEYELDGSNRVAAGTRCDPADSQAELEAQNAANMRGVFLAVSLSTGDLLFLDIYDLNALCRGSGCNTETEPDAFASIRRNRRRFGFTPSEPIQIQGSPSLVFNASQGTLDPDTGEARNSDGPGLDTIACPESMSSVFGTVPGANEVGLICSSTQPWSAPTQRWDAELGGLIPSSEGGGGMFSAESVDGRALPANAAAWFRANDVPFCQVGVLGRSIGSMRTMLPGAPEGTDVVNTQYAGDRLFITGELRESQALIAVCAQKFDDLQDEVDDFPVWFPIVRAFDDELAIGPSPNPGRYSLDEVVLCFPTLTRYEVHTRNVYTVVGTQSGFVHRTAAATNIDVLQMPGVLEGECVLDSSRPITCTDAIPAMNGQPIVPCPEDGDNTIDVDTLLAGRAFPNVQFTNPLTSFQIQPFGTEVPITDATFAELSFSIFNGFGVLAVPTSGGLPSLPSSMLFAPEFDQLFFVDLQSGVRQFQFEPLSTVENFQ